MRLFWFPNEIYRFIDRPFTNTKSQVLVKSNKWLHQETYLMYLYGNAVTSFHLYLKPFYACKSFQYFLGQNKFKNKVSIIMWKWISSILLLNALALISQFPLALGNGFTFDQKNQCKTLESIPYRTEVRTLCLRFIFASH